MMLKSSSLNVGGSLYARAQFATLRFLATVASALTHAVARQDLNKYFIIQSVFLLLELSELDLKRSWEQPHRAFLE